MGYDVTDREMIRTREELAEKLGLDVSEDQHTIMNNMVDARACYKPSGKVSRTIVSSLWTSRVRGLCLLLCSIVFPVV